MSNGHPAVEYRNGDDGEDEEDSINHSTIMRGPNQASLSRKQMLQHASVRYQEKEEARFQMKHKKYMTHKKRGLFALDLTILIFSTFNAITEAVAFKRFLSVDSKGIVGAQGFVCVISAMILMGRAVNDGRWMIPYMKQLLKGGDELKCNVEVSWRGAISVLQLVLEDFLVIIIHRIITTSKDPSGLLVAASCISLLATSMSTLTIVIGASFGIITTSIEYCFLRKVKSHVRENARRLSHLRTKQDWSRKLILPVVCFVLSVLLFSFSVRLLQIGCFKSIVSNGNMTSINETDYTVDVFPLTSPLPMVTDSVVMATTLNSTASNSTMNSTVI